MKPHLIKRGNTWFCHTKHVWQSGITKEEAYKAWFEEKKLRDAVITSVYWSYPQPVEGLLQ